MPCGGPSGPTAGAAVAAVFLLVEIALVLFLPLFLGQDPNLTDRSAGFWAAPSAQHWLGTDDVGLDLFAPPVIWRADIAPGRLCLRRPGRGLGRSPGAAGGI